MKNAATKVRIILWIVILVAVIAYLFKWRGL
jgi:hypothetical protein